MSSFTRPVVRTVTPRSTSRGRSRQSAPTEARKKRSGSEPRTVPQVNSERLGVTPRTRAQRPLRSGSEPRTAPKFRSGSEPAASHMFKTARAPPSSLEELERTLSQNVNADKNRNPPSVRSQRLGGGCGGTNGSFQGEASRDGVGGRTTREDDRYVGWEVEDLQKARLRPGSRSCTTPGCKTARLHVRSSTGLCLNCGNKTAQAKGLIVFNPDGKVAEAMSVQSKNASLQRYFNPRTNIRTPPAPPLPAPPPTRQSDQYQRWPYKVTVDRSDPLLKALRLRELAAEKEKVDQLRESAQLRVETQVTLESRSTPKTYIFSVPEPSRDLGFAPQSTRRYTFAVPRPQGDSESLVALSPNRLYNFDGHRPMDAKQVFVPTRDGPLSGSTGPQQHIFSKHGNLSGRRFEKFVPSRDGKLSDKMEKIRAEREQKLNGSLNGWMSARPTDDLDAEGLAKLRAEVIAEHDAHHDKERTGHEEKRERARQAKKEKAAAMKKKWMEKKDRWKARRLAAKEAKEKEKQAAIDAVAAEKAAEQAKLDAANKALRPSRDSDDSDDDSDDSSSESELSAGELAELAEEAAMEKAEEGDFVANICIVCAFGLPKVDYWGSVDAYVKPTFDGFEDDDEDAKEPYPRKTLNGIRWDIHKNRGKGMEVSVPIKGADLCVRNSQMPRWDFNFQIDFRKVSNPDCELRLEVYDWDRHGDDDFISMVVLSGDDIKERCCSTISTRKQGKFNLECIPDAKGPELKWGVGTLTLQFKLAENVDLMAEAQKKAFGRTKAKYISDKIRGARADFAV